VPAIGRLHDSRLDDRVADVDPPER
jgi:hypothetical protein